jgi:hypothetical protein
MDKIRISVVSGVALLALTATASAGPMTVPSAQIISPPIQIEQAHYYYRHRYRHYGWHRGWHYGWYHHRYRHYGWYHHRYHRYYGWNPAAAVVGGAVGLATLPFALATGGWPYYYGYPYY